MDLRGTEIFNREANELLQAEWVDKKTIRVAPFPFETEFNTYVKYKSIKKKTIEKIGIAKADEKTEFRKQQLSVIR